MQSTYIFNNSPVPPALTSQHVHALISFMHVLRSFFRVRVGVGFEWMSKKRFTKSCIRIADFHSRPCKTAGGSLQTSKLNLVDCSSKAANDQRARALTTKDSCVPICLDLSEIDVLINLFGFITHKNFHFEFCFNCSN